MKRACGCLWKCSCVLVIFFFRPMLLKHKNREEKACPRPRSKVFEERIFFKKENINFKVNCLNERVLISWIFFVVCFSTLFTWDRMVLFFLMWYCLYHLPTPSLCIILFLTNFLTHTSIFCFQYHVVGDANSTSHGTSLPGSIQL